MAGKRHIIVGAGTAGINAIRTLRQLGDDGEIHLVAVEPPYSRMVLPYLLDRSISEARTATVSPVQLDTWAVTRHFGKRAEGLDTAKNELKLEGGETLAYDDLLIATGSSAARPPIKGAEDPSLFTFWTLDDAKGVNARIRPDGHTVAVGAGFISFTILNGLLERSKKLTLVESEARILPRMVDDGGAAIVADWLTARGVDIRTGSALTGIETQNGRHSLSFQQGAGLEADLVLMATGVRPNLDWLADSGIDINHGIVVDDRLRASVPNVYAAGDVAEAKNLITGQKEVHAIEPTAMEHGRVAGANMAGKAISYPGSLLMNIVGVAGLDVASFGSWDDGAAEIISGAAPERAVYRKYLFHGERMTGAIMIGPSSATWSENEVGMLKGIIQSGTPLGPWKAHLNKHPFSVRKAFLATRTVAALLPKTVLGQPSPSPRG